MDDMLQPAQLGCVSEHHRSQHLTIECTVWMEDGLAKHSDDLSPGWFPRLDDLAGQFVGIDDHRAVAFEHVGDGTFSACDSAGQSHQYHGAELIMGGATPQETPLTGRRARL